MRKGLFSPLTGAKIYEIIFALSSNGDIAQLVERFNGIEEVRGSTPLISTIKKDLLSKRWFFFTQNPAKPRKKKENCGLRRSSLFGYMQPALSGLGVELCHGSLAAEFDAATLVDIEALDHHLVSNLADGVNTRHTLVAEL